MTSLRPIEIIGGGLAGLALGLALRRAQAPVSLHESGGYPRHRVCGEFITGLTEATVSRLGLGACLQDALRHSEVAWFHEGRLVHRQHLPAPARALSRHRLDARLAAAFVEAGGQLHLQSRVPPGAAQPGRVYTTGRGSAPSPWIGLKIHVRNLDLQCDLELHLGDDAYVGLTRVEDGRVNVCGLFRRRALIAKGPALILAYLDAAALPVLAGRLTGSDFDPESFAAVAAVDFDGQVPAAPGRLAVGDACARIPPFTGNGMAMAFQGAEVALDPLLAYARGMAAWPETCATIQAGLHRRFRMRLAAARLMHPFLLQPPRQRWLTRLSQARLLPFRPLYSVLH